MNPAWITALQNFVTVQLLMDLTVHGESGCKSRYVGSWHSVFLAEALFSSSVSTPQYLVWSVLKCLCASVRVVVYGRVHAIPSVPKAWPHVNTSVGGSSRYCSRWLLTILLSLCFVPPCRGRSWPFFLAARVTVIEGCTGRTLIVCSPHKLCDLGGISLHFLAP